MSKKIGWDDESVKVVGKNTKFKLEAGRVDVIRILGKCHTVYSHYIEEKKRNVGCSKEKYGKCPACSAGYKRNARFAAAIMHVAVIKGRDKKTGELKVDKVGEVKVWIFSSTVYTQIREINQEYGNVRKYNLKLTCSDTQFQRLGSILPSKQKLYDQEMREEAEANADIIDKYLRPMSPKDIKKLLEGDVDPDQDLSLDEDDDRKKKKKSRNDDEDEDDDDDDSDDDDSDEDDDLDDKKSKKKKKSKDDDDDDDEDDDEEDDDEDEDEEEDEPVKKKKKKKSKDDDDDEFEELMD